MKKITNNKIILGILIVALFLLTAGITYAYFSIVVSGNEQAKTIKVSTTTLELRYTDSLEISAIEIFPEWTTTKTVTVENTGTDKVYYSLGWQNLINTVENGELVVSAVCDTCRNIEETPVAYTTGIKAETNKVVYPLKEEIEINAGEKHTYTLTFTFKETGDVQNYNQGKKFTGVLGIAESTKIYTVAGIVEDENGNRVQGAKVTIDKLDTRTSDSVSKYDVQMMTASSLGDETDSYGKFEIQNIEVGNYILNIKDSNENNIGSKNITITSGKEISTEGEVLIADKESKELYIVIKINGNNIESIESQPTLLNKMLSADTPQSDASIDFTKDKDGCYYDFESNTLICPEGCSGNPSSHVITCEEGKGDTNGKGLYYTSDTSKTENNKVVYYYRGDVTNNYVVFARKCFRIVRTNEDGSIKLVNRGTATESGGTYTCPTYENITAPIINIAFNTNYNDNAYVGYMYGTVGSSTYGLTHENVNDSTVKTAIDTWYENTFNDNEKSIISDTIYCNDRSLAEGEFTFFGNPAKNTEISGYGQNETYYSGMKRLLTGTPQYKCSQANDKFTVSSTKGNGALKYPVALLTSDEAMYAGSIFGMISKNYLYLENGEWLMTASVFYGSHAYELVLGEGVVDLSHVYRGNGAAFPAVSLSSNIQIEKGDGTINNPYVVANQEDMIADS